MDKQIHDIKPKAKAAPRRRVAPVPAYTDTDLDLTPKTVKRTPIKSESTDVPHGLMFTLQFLAYAIPLGFLAYVLYINYLPFGYEKTFTIDVGAEGDTSVGEFYLEPSPDLGERKTAPDGTTYRELNGMANVIFKPNVVLKDAEITVSVEGEGVEIIPPVIDFNPDDYEWDYEWDFTQKETAFTPKVSERARTEWKSCTTTEAIASTTATTTIIAESELYLLSSSSTPTSEICKPAPVPDLVGNAFWFEGSMYFDGTSRLEMPYTANLFEEGPFTVYLEWMATNSNNDFQQIIGHYNWEIFQNSNSVSFRVGRMNKEGGISYTTVYNIDNEEYWNKPHSALITYSPNSIGGYISIQIDNNKKEYIKINQDVIWKDYGINNLSLGMSRHGNSSYFNGELNKIYISNEDIKQHNATNFLTLENNSSNQFKLLGNGKISDIKVSIVKR